MLILAGVTAVFSCCGDTVVSALRDFHLLGALLVAAEAAGSAARCLNGIVDYLKTRKQFGKLIGSYQALKHPTVDIYCGMEDARSFVYHAATHVTDDGLSLDAELACRMAKVQASDVMSYAGDRSVQFHGGMGFTWDWRLHAVYSAGPVGLHKRLAILPITESISVDCFLATSAWFGHS